MGQGASGIYLLSHISLSHQTWPIDDKCLIYLMTCKQCNKQYMGETTDLFRNRWNIYKDNARKLDRKESCMQEHLYKHFQMEGHKGFLNEASVTFTDKTDSKDLKKNRKILDANIENSGSLWT